ncbi:DNA-directed DNA polymerase [Tanacetum coccineum]
MTRSTIKRLTKPLDEPERELQRLRRASFRLKQNESLVIAGRNLFDDEASSSSNIGAKPPTPPKTLHEHSLPNSYSFQNPITLLVEQTRRIIDACDILLIQGTCTFQGLRNEDPLRHVKHYLSIVDNIHANGTTRDTSRLRFFHLSLKGKATEWFDRIPPLKLQHGINSCHDSLTTSFLKKQKKDDEDERLLSIFKQIHINMPFLEAMMHMPKGSKVLKDLLSHKEKLEKAASSVKLSEECSAIIQRSLPQKEGDPGSFTLPWISKLKPTKMSIQLADQSIKYPIGVCKNLLVKISKFIFPVDFVVLEMDEDELFPIILGWPFLDTTRAVIDVHEGKLSLKVGSEIDQWVDTVNHDKKWTKKEEEDDSNKVLAVFFYPRTEPVEPLEWKAPENRLKPSSVEPPKLELKLLKVLQNHKGAIAWSIADINGIDSSFYTHKILMEDEFKPSVQPQRRVNPNIKEVVKKEVIKLLNAGLIYPISDSPWVSPVQVVLKKGGMTVVKNEKDELILQRTVTRWRVCIDYRKLNNATQKDHFPLPFIDQMLERLAGPEYYCFLDGFSGYFQILIAPEDQDHIHLPLWNFCIQINALRIMQCPSNLSVLHDSHIS